MTVAPAPPARLAIGIAVPAAAVAGSLAFLVGTTDRLPDPLATHWGLGGQPNGHMSIASFALLSVALPAAVVLGAALVVVTRRDGLTQRNALVTAGALAPFFAVLTVSTVAANLDRPEWSQARHLGWIAIALSVVVLVAGGAFSAAIVGPLRPPAPPAPAPLPSVGLQPGERAVWTSHATSRPLQAMGVVALGLGGVFVAAGPRWPALVMFVVALAGLGLSEIHVKVGAEGLRVDYGPWRLPRQHIDLDDVVSAEAIDVRPTEWGGWGYRWVPWKNASAVVLRAGPGICLNRADGRRFVVTVDDPEAAAGLLNDLRHGAGR